jgi:multicomponent Na+:H+ antiporter subunit F
MFVTAAVAISLTMLLALGRAFLGPTVFDRILAANMIATNTVLLIAVLGFLTNRPDFLDLALLYALLSFVGAIAILKFVRSGGIDRSEVEEEVEDLAT